MQMYWLKMLSVRSLHVGVIIITFSRWWGTAGSVLDIAAIILIDIC